MLQGWWKECKIDSTIEKNLDQPKFWKYKTWTANGKVFGQNTALAMYFVAKTTVKDDLQSFCVTKGAYWYDIHFENPYVWLFLKIGL